MESRTPSPLLRFEFHGSAGEYFRIWIVNVCLSIVSLGLYSPWAKIRQKRYFYGSTRLAGAAFDYVANPWAILKGRLIAAAVVAAFGVATHFEPLWEVGFWLVFIIALPWVIVRSLRFNAANTVHRNLRFGFHGAYNLALAYFVLVPGLVVPMSLGLAQPWAKREQKKFIVDNSSYGTTAFSLAASTGDFFAVYLRLGLGFIVGALLLGVCAALLVPHAASAVSDMDQASARRAVLLVPLLLAWIFAQVVYMDVALNNLVWGNTSLSGIRLHCALRFWPMFFLYSSNLLGIAVSFGLLIPWAKVRVTRYRLACMGVCCGAAELDGFTAAQAETVSAFGEELGDILDVDIGL